MAFIDDRLAEARDKREGKRKATLDDPLYWNGSNDAAFAQLPQYVNQVYLAGYLDKLKELPQTADGKIQHYLSQSHFAFGYLDSPDPCTCQDEV